ncbi:recombinase family protein [Brachybacterium tyrofermentans]|uniref:recombinase family protein n=1 Tax=Brachybacterium tyrofermentans TaxID=47848 RepID=UPI003F9183A5
MTTPLPAAIYTRISSDKTSEKAGVGRQRADCQKLADRLGWNVVEVFEDNDISAHSGRLRPAYRALLEAAKRREIGGIIAWHTDRLHRRTVELEEFIHVVEEYDVQVQTVTAGDIDLSTASGRMYARTLGNLAQYEVDHATERTRRAKADAAVQGKYRGGPRPYGFEPDGVTVRETEAEAIRWATEAIIAGRSLRAVAREMNERGYRTSGWGKNSPPKEWNYQRLRAMLVRPRNAGHVHTGRAEQGEATITKENAWEAIVTDEQWRAVYGILTDPSRSRRTGNTPRHLGSGIFRCGRDGCGATLRAVPLGGTPSRKQERTWIYRCSETPHLSVSLAQSDEHVRQTVAALIRDPRVIAAMTNEDESATADRALRDALITRLMKFEDDYTNGVIDGAMYQRATARVRSELAEVEDRMNHRLRKSVSADVLGANDPGAKFLAAPIDVQRAIVATVISVEVKPAAYRGAAWSPDRLLITPAS